MIEDLQAVPSLSGGGHIKKCEKNAGDNLETEHSQRGATKDVGPTRRSPRDPVLKDIIPDRRGELKPRIEPVSDLLDQAHGDLPAEMFIRRAVGAPVVGISPAWINKLPCSTL